MGKNKAGDQAILQALQERKRQERIDQGTAQINQQFAGFNDDYFGGVSQAYRDHYLPLLEEQASTTGKDLPYGFATTQGSAYQNKLGEFQTDVERERANIEDQALKFGADQRLAVEDARSALLNQLNAGLGIESANSQAIARAQALSQPPAFSPIGDLFAKYSGIGTNIALANKQGYQTPAGERDPRGQLLYPNQRTTRVIN